MSGPTDKKAEGSSSVMALAYGLKAVAAKLRYNRGEEGGGGEGGGWGQVEG